MKLCSSDYHYTSAPPSDSYVFDWRYSIQCLSYTGLSSMLTTLTRILWVYLFPVLSSGLSSIREIWSCHVDASFYRAVLNLNISRRSYLIRSCAWILGFGSGWNWCSRPPSEAPGRALFTFLIFTSLCGCHFSKKLYVLFVQNEPVYCVLNTNSDILVIVTNKIWPN